MKTLKLFFAAALFGVAFSSHAASGVARARKFSSAYTNLRTKCKAIAGGEARGDDTPLRCGGFGGYEIRIDFSAASSHLRLQRKGGVSEDSVELAQQPLDYDSKGKIEWRFAKGKPFAVIFHVDKPKDGLDPSEMWRPENKAGESWLVKGLKGHERIDFEVAADTPDANQKARELADGAYTKGR
jgi:hypothetical protein